MNPGALLAGLDYAAIGPELILTVTACLILLIDLFYKRPSGGHLLFVGVVGLLAAIGFTLAKAGGAAHQAFSGAISVDAFSTFVKVVLAGTTLVTLLLSAGYAGRREVESAEYYALIILGTIGMMLMAAGSDLIMIILGPAISSISQYILAGF